MKNEILKRAMFAMPLSKESRNSGIMAGFDEEMPEEMPEEPETDMPQMARTPQNPEILMNTLRGDMRSTNARVQELAQMVGEQARKKHLQKFLLCCKHNWPLLKAVSVLCHRAKVWLRLL